MPINLIINRQIKFAANNYLIFGYLNPRPSFIAFTFSWELFNSHWGLNLNNLINKTEFLTKNL